MATPSTASITTHRLSALPTSTMTERCYYAMAASGLTLRGAAQKIGMDPAGLRKSLRDMPSVRADYFHRFCITAGASPSWILYGDDAPPVAPLTGSTIGERLYSHRQLVGIPYRSYVARCGVSTSAIYPLENGRRVPMLPTLLRIAAAFDINAASFFPD